MTKFSGNVAFIEGELSTLSGEVFYSRLVEQKHPINLQHGIVYDGVNIEQWTLGYGWRQNQEAKLKIAGGVIPQSNQQEADPTSSHITSVIVS